MTSFPPVSPSIPLPPRKHQEIEGAIFQMEPWSAMSTNPLSGPGGDSVQIDLPMESENASFAIRVISGNKNKDSIRFLAKNMIQVRINRPMHPQSVIGTESQRTGWTKGDEICERKKHSPNSLVEPVNTPDVKGEQVLPPAQNLHHTTLVNTDGPNIGNSPYEVRRKPVPRSPDFVSSSTFVPRNLRDASRKGTLSSFPTLDSGGFGQSCRVDLEELPRPQEIRIRNLTLKKMLGVGGQGKVYLAQGPTMKQGELTDKEECAQTIFAVKVMVKGRHANYDDTLQEQRLLRRLRGNIFLLQLEASFHDRKNFYLITEYHPGGDLDSLLKLYGHFSLPAARVYTAELCAAVTFLHENFVLHRDIKPSNILIKADGHICLGDLGLAVDFLDYATTEIEDSFMAEAEPVVQGRAGTAMYMAPEVLNREYYGFKADWWSVGVTCFNFFEGSHPWPCQELDWLAENAGSECILFQVTNDPHVRSFIRALLQRDQDQRIGDKVIFSHIFFTEMNVQDIYQGRLTPPYLPESVGSQYVPNTLRNKDMIEIGANYPGHAAPMLNYFFYGPNFPEYNSSSGKSDRTSHGHGPCQPFSCNQSTRELLQVSCAKAGSDTSNSMSLGMFIPPGRLDAISGPTVAEPFGLNDYLVNEATPLPGMKVIRKDPTFRWSMLSVEEGQFDDAPDSGTHARAVTRIVDNTLSQVQVSNSKLIIQQACEEQSGRGLKAGSIAVVPSVPSIPTSVSLPSRNAFGHKFPINFNGLASELNTNFNPLIWLTTRDSPQTTAFPSLLGLGLFVEGERNMTGIISVISLGSPLWVDTSEALASDAYTIPSTLVNSAVGEPVPSLPSATRKTSRYAKDDSSDKSGFYDHREPVVQDCFSAQMKDDTDRTLVPISTPIEYPTWGFQTLHGHAVAQIRVLLRRTARFKRLTSGWVKHFWSATCCYTA